MWRQRECGKFAVTDSPLYNLFFSRANVNFAKYTASERQFVLVVVAAAAVVRVLSCVIVSKAAIFMFYMC